MASFAFRWARGRPILVTSSAGIFILLASLLFLITATWDADLVDRRPESLFSAGPLRGGDSISQTFESPAAFLSRAEVLVRTDATDSINEPFDLIFRLSQDSVIVRQGRVEISNIADTIQSAVWEFAPLAESLKREYSLQLVVGARASRPVFVMTALVDYLPGSAVTNGIPAPDYVDMTLLVGRQVSSIQILQSIASRIPGGLPFFVLILLALGVASGLVFAGLAQGSILLSWRLASWVILGISVVAAAVAISVNLNASTSVPEGRMAFWLGMLLPSAGPITISTLSGPVWRVTARPRSAGKKAAIRAVTRLLGAPGSRSWFGTLADLHVVRAVFGKAVAFRARWGWRGLFLLAAVSLTLASVAVFGLSEPEQGTLWPPLEGGRVPSGQLSLLPVGAARQLARLTLVAWGLYAVLELGDRWRRKWNPKMQVSLAKPRLEKDFQSAPATDRRKRWSTVFLYGGVFLVAYLVRLAAFERGDFMPWWDGWGLGHSDLWTDYADTFSRLGDISFLVNIHNEGFVYVPLMALFLKAFGFYPGILWFGHFLVFISALIPLFAALTVRFATGNRLGGVVAGLLVAFDFVLIWFGLNGWSDSMTFLLTSLSFLAFVAASRNPTVLRLVLFGISLAVLAFGHGTWVQAALAWAILSWPLLATSHRWLPAVGVASGLTRFSGWRFSIPLVTLTAVLLAGFISLAILFPALVAGGLDHFPLIGGTEVRRAAFAAMYDPRLGVTDPQRLILSAQIKAFGYFLTGMGRHVNYFITAHIETAIPYYGALIFGMVSAVVVIAIRRFRNGYAPSWSLVTIPAVGIFAWWESPFGSSSESVTLLALVLVLVYLPIARVFFLVLSPILLVSFMALFLVLHQRHSSVFVYAMYLLSGVLADAAWRHLRGIRIAVPGRLRLAIWRENGASFLAVAAVVGALVVGILQFGQARGQRADQDDYLVWLGSQMGESDALLTSGFVDPWSVYELTGVDIYYDADHKGRVAVTGRPFGWKSMEDTFGTELRVGDGDIGLVGPLVRKYDQIWYFDPRLGPDQVTVTLTIYSGRRGKAVDLVRVAAYPDDPERFAYILEFE